MTAPYWSDRDVTIWHGTALHLPLDDETVDLVCTSPPYFGLRSYTDAGQHYDGQIGSEPTPGEFVDALIAATAEMVRVLKPSGSIWLNLGDKYAQATERSRNGEGARQTQQDGGLTGAKSYLGGTVELGSIDYGVPRKSLTGIPWRYALRCIDDLGLILRAEVIWSKPNGLPESVTDRVRRSHETWFHLVKQPRYYSAVDEIREAHTMRPQRRTSEWVDDVLRPSGTRSMAGLKGTRDDVDVDGHPLGKLPGSVWTIPTQPLTVPPELDVDHFAAFPMEWPRRIIQGWSPPGICTACGEGRRPVVHKELVDVWHDKDPGASKFLGAEGAHLNGRKSDGDVMMRTFGRTSATVTGYACACVTPSAPTRPAVILDPFGGTGTVALMARALGRHAHHVELSADYCRLARWRVTDPGERARAMQVDKPPPVPAGVDALFDLEAGA